MNLTGKRENTSRQGLDVLLLSWFYPGKFILAQQVRPLMHTIVVWREALLFRKSYDDLAWQFSRVNKDTVPWTWLP